MRPKPLIEIWVQDMVPGRCTREKRVSLRGLGELSLRK